MTTRLALELNYSTPAVAQPTKALLRVAYGFALLPLTAGLLDFILWLMTGMELFQGLGLFIILGGVVLFGVGIICLAVYAWQLRRNQLALRPTHPPVILLLANFPIAFATMASALYLMGQFTITVINDSDQTVQNIEIGGGLKETIIDQVPPHSRLTRKVRISTEDEATYSATVGERVISGALISYPSIHNGGPKSGAVLTITNDNETVQEFSP